jgi:hypothetical protein
MADPGQIVFDDETLNAVTSDNLFEKVNAFSEQLPAIEINLQKVKFVDPYGLVTLCLSGRYLKSRCQELSIVLPDCFDCQAYLYATNFITLVQGFMSVNNIADGLADSPKLDQEIVLELTKIEKKEIEPNKDIENVLERVSTILRNQLNFEEKEIASLSNIISELCYNIKAHSKDEGLVAVQRYQRKIDGKRYVVIGVGDLGVGIKESLGGRYDVSSWSHLNAIIQAIKKDYSAYPDRGLGLYMVSKITKDYGGALHIRSGDARLYLRYNPRGTQTVFFPGTQISISLSEQQ